MGNTSGGGFDWATLIAAMLQHDSAKDANKPGEIGSAMTPQAQQLFDAYMKMLEGGSPMNNLLKDYTGQKMGDMYAPGGGANPNVKFGSYGTGLGMADSIKGSADPGAYAALAARMKAMPGGLGTGGAGGGNPFGGGLGSPGSGPAPAIGGDQGGPYNNAYKPQAGAGMQDVTNRPIGWSPGMTGLSERPVGGWKGPSLSEMFSGGGDPQVAAASWDQVASTLNMSGDQLQSLYTKEPWYKRAIDSVLTWVDKYPNAAKSMGIGAITGNPLVFGAGVLNLLYTQWKASRGGGA